MKKFLKVIKRIGIVLAATLIMVVVLLYAVMWICVNGPSERAKNLFVMSVRETSAVGFLANLYLSKSEIDEIVRENTVVVSDEETDTLLIKIPDDDDNSYNKENENKDDEKDRQDIEFIKVSGATYKGTLAVIKDPKRVFVGVSGEYGKEEKGKTVAQIAESYGAVMAVNAGGFVDEKGFGLGGEPLGLVISEGKLKYGELDEVYELCGFTKENIMIVGRMTAKEALNKDVRDAVSFGPVLIVNGVVSEFRGTGGGLNPRTAIGQREDGAVLLLVIDGRQASTFGASYQDVANIMYQYGAVNAFNLDGGSSSALFYDGKIINSVSTGGMLRDLPTAILVK